MQNSHFFQNLKPHLKTKTMRVLITGASGQLGNFVVNSSPASYELLLPKKKELDFLNESQCRKYIKKYKPDWIINCAAFTSVDDAEENIDLTMTINYKAPFFLSEEAIKYGGKFFQISSD